MKSPNKVIQLIYALSMLWSISAFSSDGVLEINQACAINGGCFDGDTAGFPVLITNPGSYLLTSNLSVADPGTDGITLAANGISIDLNGFEIAGPETCTGAGETISCSAAQGPGNGISGFSFDNTQVRRGTIRGFAGSGVSVGAGSIAEDLATTQNANTGLVITSGTVRGCTASRNGGNGISALWASVTDSSASFNRFTGIQVGRSTVIGNISRSNGFDGFQSLSGTSVMRDNVATGNMRFGILCQSGFPFGACVITGNSITHNAAGGISGHDAVVALNNTIVKNGGAGVTLNLSAQVSGNTVLNNDGDGISVNSSSSVSNNAIRQNDGFGIFFLGSQSLYRDNTISINVGGTVGFGPGNSAVNVGGNVCNGSLTCP